MGDKENVITAINKMHLYLVEHNLFEKEMSTINSFENKNEIIDKYWLELKPFAKEAVNDELTQIESLERMSNKTPDILKKIELLKTYKYTKKYLFEFIKISKEMTKKPDAEKMEIREPIKKEISADEKMKQIAENIEKMPDDEKEKKSRLEQVKYYLDNYMNALTNQCHSLKSDIKKEYELFDEYISSNTKRFAKIAKVFNELRDKMIEIAGDEKLKQKIEKLDTDITIDVAGELIESNKEYTIVKYGGLRIKVLNNKPEIMEKIEDPRQTNLIDQIKEAEQLKEEPKSVTEETTTETTTEPTVSETKENEQIASNEAEIMNEV